jgi:phosphoadenosine phosphosulfate reductase
VKYELWHNHTTVDAPETVRYVRSIPGININYPKMSMWKLIVKKGIPPARLARYCCQELKENGGEGRFIVTGVRKSESINRSGRESLEIKGKTKKDAIVFTGDNDENKVELYHCINKGSPILNPIIDWNDNDVWDFLNYYDCESNPLYKCGWKRIGCIGCPMAQGKFGQLWEFERYPKYKNLYIRAFDKMLKKNKDLGKTTRINWSDGEGVFDWWTSGKAAEFDIDGQLSLWEDI